MYFALPVTLLKRKRSSRNPAYFSPQLDLLSFPPIGRARAMEMTLLGERVPAAKALDWGLINRVVPDADLMTEATKLAVELSNGPKALGMIRKLMWRAMDADWADQLHDEAKIQNEAGRSADFAEGVKAFLEKRPAVFAGK